ncbi:unnamed protein product, partial [Durusdinium trenchii]
MGAYYDWHHGRYNPNPDYREEPGPFEPPSAEKPDPQDEEVRHEVEELAETAAHDYADADLSEDEKESVRKAKGKSKKTLERIKLSSRGQTDTGVLDTKILKTYSSDGAPGQCDYCRSNGNDTPVVSVLMRTEINEKEVPVQEVFKRGFFYGSGTQDATDRRRKKMAELIDDVER